VNSQMQSALVENTLLELFSRSTPPLPPKVVVYLTYHFVGMDQAFQTLQKLRKQKIRTRLLIDDSVFHYITKKEIVKLTENDDWISLATLEKMEDLEHLFLPVLSFSLVSSIIALNDQNPFIRFLLQSLLSGKKVSALSIGMNPKHTTWLKNGLTGTTPLLKSTLHTQLQKLRGFGVHLIEPEEALAFFLHQPEKKKTVYTGKNIEQLVHSNKKEIIIDQQTIMTPLALDLLKQHQINLIRK
jgi:hypothetical protein